MSMHGFALRAPGGKGTTYAYSVAVATAPAAQALATHSKISHLLPVSRCRYTVLSIIPVHVPALGVPVLRLLHPHRTANTKAHCGSSRHPDYTLSAMGIERSSLAPHSP